MCIDSCYASYKIYPDLHETTNFVLFHSVYRPCCDRGGIDCLGSDCFVQASIRFSIDLFGFRLEFRLADQGIITCFRNSRDRDFICNPNLDSARQLVYVLASCSLNLGCGVMHSAHVSLVTISCFVQMCIIFMLSAITVLTECLADSISGSYGLCNART